MALAAAGRSANDDPSLPIPQKGHDQRTEAHQNSDPSKQAPHESEAAALASPLTG
jgi:hypothetical protein